MLFLDGMEHFFNRHGWLFVGKTAFIFVLPQVILILGGEVELLNIRDVPFSPANFSEEQIFRAFYTVCPRGQILGKMTVQPLNPCYLWP
jgi:hypothetical protein